MTERFDLLGDPVPENWGGPGRPEHIPTRDNRLKVIRLLALNWKPARIAKALGIAAPTLRKHYFSELAARASARDRLEAQRLDRLCDKAVEGSLPAIKELGRLIEKADLVAGAEQFARPAAAKKAEKLGKKAAAVVDARTAHEGTSWGSLLQ